MYLWQNRAWFGGREGRLGQEVKVEGLWGSPLLGAGGYDRDFQAGANW